MNPEDELLLCCARTRLDETQAERIRELLQQELDWDFLLNSALRHGMMPLVYWHLKSLGAEAMPEVMLDRFRDHFHQNLGHNLQLTAELFQLINLFKAQGIPVITFKGPALAASVYGNLALRQFGDLDILVHEQDVPRAKQVLIAAGYLPKYHLTPVQERHLMRIASEYPFTREDSDIEVELHWALMPTSFYFPMHSNYLWDHLESIPLAGNTVQTLATEDLLIYLCVHGFAHQWERLEWICCIAELLRSKPDLNWKRIMSKAARLTVQPMLLTGLFLAHDLLGAPLPSNLVRKLHASPAVRALDQHVRGRLFARTQSPSGFLEGTLFTLRGRYRFKSKVRALLHLLFSPTQYDLMLISLPISFYPLYFVLRPMRLGSRHALAPIKHFVSSKARKK